MTYSPIIAPDRVPVVRAHPAASAVTTLGRLEGGAPFEVILMAVSQLRHSDSRLVQALSRDAQDRMITPRQTQRAQFEAATHRALSQLAPTRFAMARIAEAMAAG